jgi:hypothetical protein
MGMVIIRFTAGDNVGSGIAVQFDDKIVVVGISNNVTTGVAARNLH